MMTEEVKNALQKEDMSGFHESLMAHCQELVTMSRNDMGKYYAGWDKQSDIYEAYRVEDRDDRRARKDKEPKKMVIPLSTAQINTFISACFLMMFQRKRFYEFEPTGPEDYAIREVSELILARDLKANKFSVALYQFLLDIGRFGIGIFKHGWYTEKVHVLTPAQDEIEGVEVPTEDEYQEFTSFNGNKVVNISPYRFFPDTRLPFTRIQEGEFCASEDEVPLMRLEELESFGEISGVKWVEPMTKELLHKRQGTRFSAINTYDPRKTPGVVLITEIQVKLVPSKFEIAPNKFLGKEKFPVHYLVWYANDQRILKVEPARNYHSQFTYDIAQYTPDQHKQLNQSLSGMVEMLQETIDWVINSRVTSIKRTLDNQLVVDPTGVDMKTVENRSRVIKLRRNVGKAGIDRYIKPLPITDATANHLNDAQQLSGIMQMVTGINDAALGQAQTGRRSATEMKAVVQGAASRLVMNCKLIWEQALSPMGQKLLINSRQNIQPDDFLKIVGEVENIQELYMQYAQSATELIGQADFFVFDGTLPTEKAFLAQSLQELAGTLMQTGLYAEMGIDIKKLIAEIYELRGVTGLQRFKMTPEEQMQQMVQQQVQQQLANANGQQPTNQPNNPSGSSKPA